MRHGGGIAPDRPEIAVRVISLINIGTVGANKRGKVLLPPLRVSLQLSFLGISLAALYYVVLVNLVRQWIADPNYSHGILVPLFAAFLCWKHRHTWTAHTLRPSYYALILIVGALTLLAVGTLGAELFLPRLSFVLILGGLVAYFAGWRVLKALLVPWLVLLLMIPLPVIVLNEIAFPLQLLASRLAGLLVDLFRIPILREGNIIILPSLTLDVVEACSGIRSLMTLITLAVFYGLLAERRPWMRWLLVVFSVPIAVAANAVRILGAALLGTYAGPRFAEGFFHSFSGWLIFVLALAFLITSHSISSRLVRLRTAA